MTTAKRSTTTGFMKPLDAKLQAVFAGQLQVSMFEMTKLVSAHLRA